MAKVRNPKPEARIKPQTRSSKKKPLNTQQLLVMRSALACPGHIVKGDWGIVKAIIARGFAEPMNVSDGPVVLTPAGCDRARLKADVRSHPTWATTGWDDDLMQDLAS